MQVPGKRIFVCLSIVIMVLNHIPAPGNDMPDDGRHKTGFIAGYGGQNPGLFFDDVQYDYRVWFLQFQYYYALLKIKTWSLEAVVQPQYNITRFRINDQTGDITSGYEFGLNAGIMVMKKILKGRFSPYLLVSTGPHYVSGTPERQSSGFIFSDNLFVGMHIRASGNFYVDVRPGFRHISNAGIKEPNGGVNDFIISAGFSLVLPIVENRQKIRTK